MRAICVGLLVAAGSAVAGCTPGMSDYWANYNGMPWPWLINKSQRETPSDELIRTPQYSSAQRFNKPAGGADAAGNAASGDSASLGTTTPFDQEPSAIKNEPSGGSP